MSPVIRTLSAIVASIVLLATSGEASAASKCSGNKIKATGKKAASKLKCHSKAVKKGLGVDPECLAKAEEKFADDFATAEAKTYPDAGCLTTGDAAEVETQVDDFVDAIVARLSASGSQIRVNEDISSDTTWSAGNTYVLPRLRDVFVQPGATLTIEPGTLVVAEEGSSLVITRGARIEAVGTAAAPIVMTSAEPAGSRSRGDWGGLILLGDAPINTNVLSTPSSTEARLENFPPGIPEGRFGGANPNDDSGTLRYVRISFGGFNFVSDRKLANLTLAGVGSGTEIDFVQCHQGRGDGVDVRGGTVNLKHVVSSQNADDGLDVTEGWQGKGQFLVVQHVLPDGAAEAANGYESDNHATATSYVATPRTLPLIYNATFLGDAAYAAGSSFAAVFRRGTGGQHFNVIFQGFPKGIEARDTATKDQLDIGNLYAKNSIFFQNDGGNNWPDPQPSGDIDEASYFTQPSWSNREVDPGLPATAFNLTSPNFVPTAGAAALTGAATPPNDGFFDPSATFVGAVGAVDWTTLWTSFAQN